MTKELDSLPTKVFLSYARTDRNLAYAISRELKKAGFDVWDDKSIEAGIDWAEGIKNALHRCNSMIALLNEHSFSSSYVREELEHAFFDERYKYRLLPVLIGGESDSVFSRLPWVLMKLQVLRIPTVKSPEIVAKKITQEFVATIKAKGRHAT
jgi:hypothetical protein